MAELHCIVVTPEETSLETTAESVVLPMFDGEMGVLSNRAALIGRLGSGEIRFRQGDQLERYFVEGGFVQVSDNTISVLTSRAIPVSELDAESTASLLQEALAKPARSPEEQDIRARTVQRLRAQLRVSKRPSE
jgi:F-type H+-transporting ATPase subunit epsilon